jgi:hypothetical protein
MSCDRHRVEETETHRPARRGVVSWRADHAESVGVPSSRDGLDRLDETARGGGRGFPGRPRNDGIGIEAHEASLGESGVGRASYVLYVLRRVGELQAGNLDR